MNYGVYVGGVVPEALEALTKAVITILEMPYCDQKTKQLALKTVNKGIQSPHGLSFNNVNINQEIPKPESPISSEAVLTETEEDEDNFCD